MNSLAKVLLFSGKGLAVITSSIVMGFLAAEAAKAELEPSCFAIDTSGEVINLADICNVQPQPQPKTNAVTPIKDATRVYFVGDGSIPFTLETSNTIYYSGEGSAYVRRYRAPQTFSTRDDARNTLLELGLNTRRVTVSSRTPFIIYRYQK